MKFRALSNWLLERARIGLFLCAVLWPLLVVGQTNDSSAVYPANRYLLVVETSRSMQRRNEQMTQSIRDLLSSSMAGQARKGDTLGVWTFNEEVYTGLLPLQQWSPDAQKTISQRVLGFLAAQKFEKRGRPGKVLPMLDRVVRGSPFITVILVCFGDEDFHGTPFDARVNEFFRTWHLRQQDEGTPFVIAFRGQNGRLVDCMLNPSPWAPELPALPKELLIPLPPPPRPVVKEVPSKPTSTVPPLIISGKKKDPAPLVKAPDATIQPGTNVVSPPSVPANVAAADTSPKPPANPTAPPTIDDANPKVPANPASSSATPAAGPGPQRVVPGTPNQSATVTPEPRVPPNTDSIETPQLVALAPNPSKSKPSARVAELPKSVATGKNPATTGQQSPETKQVQVATAAPPGRPGIPAIAYGAGGLALIAIVGAVWMWRRRSRSGDELSLITESIDKRKK